MTASARDPLRVAVIGGGYAGMAAAQSLAARGVRVSVFETAKVLGGRARKIEVHGEVLDNGQHILSGAYSTLLGLMRDAAVPDSHVLRVPLTLSMPPAFHMQAPRWPAPLHMASALLTAKGLNWSDRIAAIHFMLALRASRYNVKPGETVAELMSRLRQTPANTRHLWQPLAVGALNTPIESASAQVFVNVLRDALDARREASDLLLPRVDLSALYPEAAASFVLARGGEVRTGCRVLAINPQDKGVGVGIDGTSVVFDAVIVAVGPHQLASFNGEWVPDIAGMSFEAIETVYFKFDTAIRLTEPMLGQATGHVQWFFDRRALLDPAAKDGLIAGVVSAADPALDIGEDAVWRELTAHFPALPRPAWTKTVTEKFATFACTPQAQPLRPGHATRHHRVVLAGDYLASPYPATLETAARSGVNVGEAIFRTLAQH
ncbi:MAG: FAD-dependent oxidoreductase [Betaproteobacteria bacterium]|nr:FAD-dependent oxidoreductase [Betaproteobacteria bacterium]